MSAPIEPTDAVAQIVEKARELQLPAYTVPEAAETLLERRLKVHSTVRTALHSAIRTLEQRRRSLNADGERQATARWNKKNREAIIERDAARRIQERQALRMRRDSQPLATRISDGILRARRLGGLRALTVDPTGGGRSAESTRVGPPNAESAAYDRFVRLLGAALVGLERELDDIEFGTIVENGPQRQSRVQRDYAGLPPEVVAYIDPTTGSASTVRRDRIAGGLDGRRGTRPARVDEEAA